MRGPIGETGPACGVLNYADFYALMPPDNAAKAAQGTDVSFPQDGPDSGSDISRTGSDSFNLAEIVGMAIVTTTVINSILIVRNPASNSTALTITSLAGGTLSVSAHLVTTQIG